MLHSLQEGPKPTCINRTFMLQKDMLGRSSADWSSQMRRVMIKRLAVANILSASNIHTRALSLVKPHTAITPNSVERVIVMVIAFGPGQWIDVSG